MVLVIRILRGLSSRDQPCEAPATLRGRCSADSMRQARWAHACDKNDSPRSPSASDGLPELTIRLPLRRTPHRRLSPRMNDIGLLDSPARSRRPRPRARPSDRGRRRRDRGTQAGFSRAADHRAARSPAVPPAAAALAGRRGGRAVGLCLAAIEEIARHDGSLGWNMFVANSSALIAPLHSVRGGAHDLRRSARPDLLGTAQPAQARRPRPAAIASPANGISPRAIARPPGSARTATSWSPTARCAATASAARPCARC